MKPTQIFHQVYYRVKRVLGSRNAPLRCIPNRPRQLQLEKSVASRQSLKNTSFTFLNVQHDFTSGIDWNIDQHGKLWVYNLNYFDYLHQEDITQEEANVVFDSFLANADVIAQGIEPYPISVRGINWIKYFIYSRIDNEQYNSILYSHYQLLNKNIEYHLLGNHLLENGFSLLFAAVYFDDHQFARVAEQILRQELAEQILDDGAHFELSPMYHQLLLLRLLDCINLLQNNSTDHAVLCDFLKARAAMMIAWLKEVTFENGDVPMVNDCAAGIAPDTAALLEYAKRLSISNLPTRLGSSGYRMIRLGNIELFVDIGNIGPDYIPGHAHSDTFNFILYKQGSPVIVDTGTSTYENNSRRWLERSTISHNTVMVGAKEQSEVWSSFRVGKRAKVVTTSAGDDWIMATHDGYKGIGALHQRRWQWGKNELIIEDWLEGNSKMAEAYLHFHPDVSLDVKDGIVQAAGMIIKFTGALKIVIEEYDFASGFNKNTKSKKVKVSFQQTLGTSMTF